MKKTTLVFSLIKEQSIFMTAVMSILTFISVLAFGIALSIGSGIIKWNTDWDRYATIQIVNSEKTATVKKILDANKDKIKDIKEISKSEMEQIMQHWVSSGAKLNNYLPQMIEIKVQKKSDLVTIKEQITPHAKFLTHASALKTSISAGWKLLSITIFVLIILLISIGICVSYISRNIAMLHKHELEILNQVGATDGFIARQMQIIIAKISSIACLIGFLTAVPVIAMILATAHSARIGLLATLSLSGGNIIALALLPVVIIILSIYITKKTTLKILSEN
jgi:cell division protein FtsX